jgi:ATP/maltotriose-dependent transcriptional regulator MalT
MQLAACLFDAGDPSRARAALERVIAEATTTPLRAEALHRLALVRLHTDGFVEAVELGRRAIESCAEEQSTLLVNIMTGLAFAEVNVGAAEAALTTIAEAVAIAERHQLSGALGQALTMREMLRFMAGEGVEPAILDRAVRLEFIDAGGPVAFRPSVHRALLLAWTGELAVARDALARVETSCAALGEEGEMMFIAFHLALIDIWRGNLQQASATAEDALARAHQLGGDAPLFIALTIRAAVATYQGRVDDARRDLAEAVAAAGRSGSTRLMEWTVATHGFLELSLGDHAKTLAAVEPLLPMLQMSPMSSEIIAATFIPDAAEAMVNVGRLDEAEALIDALERNGTRLDRAWMLAVGARCRAMLCAARGDVAAGAAHAQAALTHHDRIEMPFERARTLLTLGRLERRRRHWRPAAAALTEALATFEAVGTPLWAAQARRELDRGTAGRSPSKGLTPAERRVAELAASGMTNRDIATRLFIARKTVEVNLSRAYHKLGIHSRIELFHVLHDAASNVPAVEGEA